MKTNRIYSLLAGALAVTAVSLSSCDDEKELPKIDGYNNSNEVAASSLVAHWTFDDNNNERISNTAPSNTFGTVASTDGVIGKALNLQTGALKYPSIQAIGGANSLSNYTVSLWVNVQNNGSDFTTFFGIFPTNATAAWGNLSASAETGWFPNRGAGDTLVLKANYLSQDPSGPNGQDNRNDPRGKPPVGVLKATGTWTHFVMRWDATSHNLKVYANGTSIGAYDNRGTTGPLIQAVPSQAVIGSLATPTVGFAGSTDTWPKMANAMVDDIRVFNSPLTDAEITALYNLGTAGR
ncbi:MAG TPA: LamG-like jellyroll fold domain-containing protein [Chryseosolibacter sp.]